MSSGVASPLAFITGASSGIGQALAAHYARSGWRLALVARRAALMQQWARGWDGGAGLGAERCAVFEADVNGAAGAPGIAEAAAACIAAHGLPQLVVANAGISIGADLAERDDLGVVEEVLRTNVLGVAATLQPFIAPMRARGSGTLVVVSSVAAVRGMPGHGAYCASKAAVSTLAESLRSECRGSGVRVVTLMPGYVATPLTSRNRFPMPFLLPADVFAVRAARAIERGAGGTRIVPWQMALVAPLLRALPNAVFDRLVARQPRKGRRTPA
jgi:NADP-dependent 3-hydroxy acid dehydrogenase YdfG